MKILDCSIRDGGYVNNWKFSREQVRDVYTACLLSRVDYCEIGFRRTHLDPKFGDWYYTPESLIQETLSDIVDPRTTKLVLMAQMGTFTIEDFVPRKDSLVSMVRLLIAYHCKNQDDTVLDTDMILETCKMSNQLKDLGYEVCINIGRIDKLRDDQLDTCAKLLLDNSQLDYLYIADTYGNLGIVKLNTIVYKIRQTYRRPIGFHAHDNLLNATVKSIDVSYNGVEMVDGTIGGIGRGSGNAKTELLVAHTVIKGLERYKIFPLLEYAEKWVSSYKTNHVLYFITGMYSMHVNYAIHLIENYDISFAKCYDILMTVYKHQRHHFFDEKYLKELIF